MKRILSLCFVLAAFAAIAAPTIPWRVPAYSVTARAMSVRELLETFAVAEGVPTVLSKAVDGVVSGSFKDVPAAEFLDRIATIHNFTWYYDGATLWVYGSGEVVTTLIDLRYMKAGEVLSMMRELGVEDARFPIKKASNDELIMVSGPPRYVTLVAEMIGKADRLREIRTFAEVETRLFPLQNTWADSVCLTAGGDTESQTTIRGVASLLQEIMGADISARTREGTNETGRATAEERAASVFSTPVIRADNRLNAVLVRDVSTRMPTYERIIRELDVPQKLVEIGITVLEMSREDALDWEASVTVGFNDSRNSAFLGQNANNLMSTAADAALAGLTGGYSYLGDRVNVSASIHALKKKGKARNIMRSSLLTLNNLAAEMSDTASYNTRLVGEKVASVQETSAGTRLVIKPRVVEPPSGLTNAVPQIWLTMELQDGGLDFLALVDEMPTKRTTVVQTQAALPEDHALLLAGNFRDVDEEGGWGIPYLRDIPWIGWLFGGASRVKTTVQRLFILTPHIVDIPRFVTGDTNGTAVVQMLRQRDITAEEKYVDLMDRDDQVRREREEKLQEERDILHETFKEEHSRNHAERGLRRDQRHEAQRDDHELWEEDFKKRKEAWRQASDEKEKKKEND